MDLILTVIRYKSLPPQQPTRARIGLPGGTIGRRPDNDLSLPDAERWVSGQHARIQFRDGAFYLTDTSKNGTFVNQAATPLREGQEAKLQDGDELGIGAYEIRVSLVPKESQAAAPFDPFASGESESEPFGEPMIGEKAPDILDLVGPAPLTPEPASRAPTAEEQAPLPADWLMEGAENEEPWRLGDAQRSPEASLPPAQPDHTPDERAFFRPPSAIPEGYDIWTDEPEGAPGRERTAPAPREAPPAEPSFVATEPEAPEPPRPEAPSATPLIPPSAPSAPEREIAKAFLAGLGCGDLPSDPEAQARLMLSAGLLMRGMTEGLMRVLMARTSFKSALRLEMTTIRAAGNNPFKFSVDPGDALRHLLFQPSRGFLPPLEAAREAFDDIQRHEMAIIAGLRAALRALLARLDPAQLEQRFRDRSVLDNLMPMALKAKYWDLYSECYGEVAADAADDFLRLFGDAFSRAYEEQTEQLKKSEGGEQQSGR